jgi:hypothetical protein
LRFHLLSRPLAAALLLAASPSVAPAQSASIDFAAATGGFSSVDFPAGTTPTTAWQHAVGTGWSIQNQGTGPGTGVAYSLQSPSNLLTVTEAGQVTGSLTHRFSFGYTEVLESFVNYDGGIIQYRVNGTGGWLTVGPDLVGSGDSTVGYSNTVIVSGTENPLVGLNGFAARSPGYNDSLLDTTNFTLGEATAAEFLVGDQIEIRFVAGFSGDEDFTSQDDPNWQIASLSLHDASPVPEPGGVLGAAALAVAGFGLTRRPRK